jgi:tetratricopeptide (TPR) repeat protein
MVATTGMALAIFLARLAAAEGADSRADVWDQSVVLETQGDLAGAERLMVRQWGEHPDNYWAGLRLAYLALLQEHYEEARQRYQSLRDRPEAEGDSDVVRGQASAIAGMGWDLAKLGGVADARSAFRLALAIDSANASAKLGLKTIPALPVAVPEIWTGMTGQSLGSSQYLGWVAYAQLPVRLGDSFVLRAAGRYVSAWASSGRSRWAFSDQGPASWTLNEQYLSLARDSRLLGFELVAVRSDTSVSRAILGGAGRARVGSTAGVFLEGAVLHASGVTTNTQVRPMAFVWLGQYLGLQAGARLTWDDRGNSVSASAGASVFLDSLALHLQGHAGNERWAFGFVGPSLMSFASAASYGGSATLIWSATSNLRLALQGEGERLHQEGATGAYWSISGGVQLALGAK